ncbi:septum formation initiator family protein [Streptomyces sp. LP05-1]|uniref:Septum formation initiator family protein n=1 Tax=Streptomyces pyxinae TaxID=2970734 RepID=A0ABT2CG81_9ACTN|nr:septum formation initiator family protein [Streptomyces sp. LP05-1]MCS0636396.1 septum formation initiator family protein [Streptomyces sp. LP05-1]
MSKAGPLRGRAARLAGLMPSGPSTAARTPFVLLVVVLLGGGLITLLLLNSSLNQGSFELSELKKRTTELTDEQQALQRDVDDRSAPEALERRARELGMVPGGSPAFLDPDGSVHGVPRPATAEPSPEPARPSAPAQPQPRPQLQPQPQAPPQLQPQTQAPPQPQPQPRTGPPSPLQPQAEAPSPPQPQPPAPSQPPVQPQPRPQLPAEPTVVLTDGPSTAPTTPGR